MKYYYILFLKKRLLLFKKHFETDMIMSPKNIFILCHSTVHPVNRHIERFNDRMTHARCKNGRSGQRRGGGVGTKHSLLLEFKTPHISKFSWS